MLISEASLAISLLKPQANNLCPGINWTKGKTKTHEVSLGTCLRNPDQQTPERKGTNGDLWRRNPFEGKRYGQEIHQKDQQASELSLFLLTHLEDEKPVLTPQ